jgi:hypothetical protein
MGSVVTAGLRTRARHIRIESADIPWSFGEGPVVTGPSEAILMALNGRAEALSELSGPGSAVLAGRLRRRGAPIFQ